MITMIDYGASNIRSAQKAFEYIGAEVELTADPEVVCKATKLVLPGVGAFGDGMESLRTKRLVEPLRRAAADGTPLLGICLGMQLEVIEFARNVAGIDQATSAEFNKDAKHAVIDLMPDQRGVTDKGGTMRLGAYPCDIKAGTMAAQVYGTLKISERHRHRYEFNNDYRDSLEAKGLVLSGLSPDGRLVELVELPDHPYFVGCQFHPEFKSRPNRPHPLFRGLIEAGLKYHQEHSKGANGHGRSRDTAGGAQRSAGARQSQKALDA